MTKSIRSPFLTVDNFISPLTCEKLIRDLGIRVPTKDEVGRVIKNERIINDADHVQLIKSLLQEQVELIEDRYQAVVNGMTPPVFQQYFEDPKYPCEPHGCESAIYTRKKWLKVKDVDLVGFIWLKDFQSGVPLDPRMEVYGGKLEFPAYNFSIVPQRGTLVLYPAGPHFITAISPILVGTLEQIKISIKLKTDDGSPWLYSPEKFPGNYQQWFAEE